MKKISKKQLRGVKQAEEKRQKEKTARSGQLSAIEFHPVFIRDIGAPLIGRRG